MTLTLSTAIGRIAADNPASVAVFERHGLDYCCGGKQSLAEACDRQGIVAEAVLAEILEIVNTSSVEPEDAIDWTKQPLPDLVDHLLRTHHAYLHENLERLDVLADKVARVHGENHPELVSVRNVYGKFFAELSQHMRKEEMILFPGILRIEGEDASFPIWQPIAVMESEHDQAGQDLAKLRELTGGYQVPEDACTSYRMLMDGLARMESDTITHIHKENNILFPRAMSRVAVG